MAWIGCHIWLEWAWIWQNILMGFKKNWLGQIWAQVAKRGPVEQVWAPKKKIWLIIGPVKVASPGPWVGFEYAKTRSEPGSLSFLATRDGRQPTNRHRFLIDDGSRNQCHGSLLQPPMCKTQKAGVHLQPHAPPRAAWSFSVDLNAIEDRCWLCCSNSKESMPSSYTFISKKGLHHWIIVFTHVTHLL